MTHKTLAIATYKDLQLIGYLISNKKKLYIIGTLSDGKHGIFPSSKLKNIRKLGFKRKPNIKVSEELMMDNAPESIWLKELINKINH